MTNKPKVVVICGPTGVGKTSVAIELAEAFEGEIVSADSMQIYRHMDIGTAKPSPVQKQRVTHHMIDIVAPDEPFDAARFEKLSQKKITDLFNIKKTPFVVGGTGLYIKALLHGMFRDRTADQNVIQRLKNEAVEYGPSFLHTRLRQNDPEAAEKIHPNDIFRIVRALEIYEATGKPISQYQLEHGFRNDLFKVLKIGLHLSRKTLYDRIDHRVDAMIDEGFLEEVKWLLDMGYSATLNSMQSIGYRHMAKYVNKNISWDETLRTMKRDTRRYAKRQLTWFKADPQIKWIKPDKIKYMHRLIKEFITAQ